MFKSLIAFIFFGLIAFGSVNSGYFEPVATETKEVVENVESKNDKVIFDLTVDENAVVGQRETRTTEEIQAELNKKVEDGMITISINLCPVFADGSSKGLLRIVNEKANKHPQMVEIYRIDNKELVYKSGLIPVGSGVEYDRLLIDLDKGEYPCVAYISSVGVNGEILGKAGAEMLIKIEG